MFMLISISQPAKRLGLNCRESRLAITVACLAYSKTEEINLENAPKNKVPDFVF